MKKENLKAPLESKVRIKILTKLAIEIQNSTDLRDQDKNKLLKLIAKTKKTIPLLTNEKYSRDLKLEKKIG